jgi:hypothetical protein
VEFGKLEKEGMAPWSLVIWKMGGAVEFGYFWKQCAAVEMGIFENVCLREIW